MKYLITGITGTLGQAVSKILLNDNDNQVVGFSRDEFKQADFPKHERLTLYIGDIRNRDRLLEASRGVDLIFHFASLKHIDILEANPEEAIATIIDGTSNVLHVQRMLGIKRVVLSSTDKAAYPINAYGMCKGIAEKLVLRNKNNVVCRYGNVLASRGSVIQTFIKTLKEEKTIYLTNYATNCAMTRFWITIDDAARFIVSKNKCQDGGFFIPFIKAARVDYIAGVIANIMGIDSYETKYIGERPGEKINECLLTDYEGHSIYSNTAPQFEFNELYNILKPIVNEELTK